MRLEHCRRRVVVPRVTPVLAEATAPLEHEYALREDLADEVGALYRAIWTILGCTVISELLRTARRRVTSISEGSSAPNTAMSTSL